MSSTTNLYDIEVIDYKKNNRKLSEYKEKVLIIVNVASKCGLAAKNYERLSEIIDKYYQDGLRILLFPCNNFLNQEPNHIDQIAEMVKKINDKMEVFDKINVLSDGIFKYVLNKNSGKQHELFRHLTNSFESGWLGKEIKWNFTKFLIDREGKTINRYGPNDIIKENDVLLKKALDKNLKK